MSVIGYGCNGSGAPDILLEHDGLMVHGLNSGWFEIEPGFS